jgi:hypothetical protein
MAAPLPGVSIDDYAAVVNISKVPDAKNNA